MRTTNLKSGNEPAAATRRLGARLLQLGAEPHDAPESALRKSLLVVAAIAFIAAGLLWGALYASMGLYAAAAIPGGYGVLSLASLVASPVVASYLPARAAPPPAMATILFVLNIGCVAGLVVALLYYFVTQRDRLLAQREAAHVREVARAKELEWAYAELEAVQAQLIHAEKMASLGRMTAGVAHELKNPLNFISNFAELSADLVREIREERAADPQRPLSAFDGVLEDLEANATKIVEHGRRADGIVRGMLVHAGGRAGERREADMHELLDEAVGVASRALLSEQPAIDVAVERRYDERAGRAEVVPEELRRAFVNLLDNAFYSVRERASSSATSFEPRVVIETRRKGSRLEVRISDNGSGVAVEDLPRMFEPFFTRKPTGQGHAGLGLSLAYEIVTQLHEGRLTATSEGGVGATFMVELPTPGRPDDEPAHAPETGGGVVPGSYSPTVL